MQASIGPFPLNIFKSSYSVWTANNNGIYLYNDLKSVKCLHNIFHLMLKTAFPGAHSHSEKLSR